MDEGLVCLELAGVKRPEGASNYLACVWHAPSVCALNTQLSTLGRPSVAHLMPPELIGLGETGAEQSGFGVSIGVEQTSQCILDGRTRMAEASSGFCDAAPDAVPTQRFGCTPANRSTVAPPVDRALPCAAAGVLRE